MNLSDEDIAEFRTEAVDLLDLAEEGLLQLDRGGDFKVNYDAVFRVFHSLKGGGGMLGLNELQAHMHKLENKLSESKARGVITKTEISFFLRGVDSTRKILAGEPVIFEYELVEAPTESSTGSSAKKSTHHKPTLATSNTVTEPHDQLTAYLVDDEPEIAEGLRTILSEAGMNVVSFTEAEQLLTAVKKAKPDVVITDYKMPNVTGLDVLKQVKELDSDLPVIFLSGYLSKDVLMEGIKNGLFATIEKPFRDADVIAHCLNAGRQYRLYRALNRTMNLLIYQFSDLDDFLKSQGKEQIRETLKNEIDALIKYRRTLRHLQSVETSIPSA